MTEFSEFTMPPFAVDYDARWVGVDLRGDLPDWARRAAREVMSRAPGRHGGREEKRVTALLEGAGALARRNQGAAIALLLYPSLDDGVKAVVTFSPVDLAGRDPGQAWDEVLTSLPPGEPPEVTEIATRAGPCRRMRQRYSLGAEDPERPVGERLGYVWIFQRYRAAVVMSTAFTDLLEAGRWRPALDALAAAAEIGQGGEAAGTGQGGEAAGTGQGGEAAD